MMMNNIISYLDKLFPNPKCELNYSNDYELLIAVMLSAQTTDKRVNKVTNILFSKYNCLNDLSKANINDIMNIIKPLGTFRKKSQNVIDISKALLQKNSVVPNDRIFLESLPGVGRKTTNVVLSILYNEKCIAVDTHVARVSKRLGLANENDNVLEIEKKLTKLFENYNTYRIHHQLLLFGRYYCKAIKPSCISCRLKGICKEKNKNG